MKAVRFRIQNFRNIDDSGWIPIEQVTAFVGCNESGKTALLKAFHKFNPATPEPYDPQREFPRDRYTRDYIGKGAKGGDWPVCSVVFTISPSIKADIAKLLGPGHAPPDHAILTRYYDGSLAIEYEPSIEEMPLSPKPVLEALSVFASSARRLPTPSPEQDEATAALRTSLAQWATEWQDRLKPKTNLRNAEDATLLTTLRGESENKSDPQTADMVEALQATVTPVLDAANTWSIIDRIDALIGDNIPVLIYFEDYGILDSAIWFPRFLDDLERDKLIYTTHSPFLIDGEHLHRVRPVTEDETGHSRINIDTWPKDRETIFPLQAAAGYAMVRGLFQHRNNVLVEGMSDYYYLHALSQQCQKTSRAALPDNIYITPCGGAKLVGHLASLFLGQEVRPLVLLDGDDAGRARRDALFNDLYAGHQSAVLMLDNALGRSGQKVEVEDILGEAIMLSAVNAMLGTTLSLTEEDRMTRSLPSQIKAAAQREGIELPNGWKASVSIQLVSEWAEQKALLADTVLDAAASLFSAIRRHFQDGLKDVPETNA